MDKNLKIPDEDENLKNLLLYMWIEVGRVRLGNHMTVTPDSVEVWESINNLPRYIWESWKDDLTAKGFTRGKFLRLMKYMTDDMLLWSYDRIPWVELIDRILKAIAGPIAKDILEGKGRY